MLACGCPLPVAEMAAGDIWPAIAPDPYSLLPPASTDQTLPAGSYDVPMPIAVGRMRMPGDLL